MTLWAFKRLHTITAAEETTGYAKVTADIGPDREIKILFLEAAAITNGWLACECGVVKDNYDFPLAAPGSGAEQTARFVGEWKGLTDSLYWKMFGVEAGQDYHLKGIVELL